ncbi:MAG: hypothetical protein BroJett003_23810 [Planctomycetota bacterium]|nr:MAG: hypothetical protein BroJett003_23810 [Planctomycetota bacterium]
MIDRTRTFRVLACLVLSMTGLTVGLELLQASGGRAVSPGSDAIAAIPDASDDLATRENVLPEASADGRSIRPTVEFVAVGPGGAPEADPNAAAHFVLSADGRLSATRRWLERPATPGTPDVIRVLCEAPDGEVGGAGVIDLLESLSRLGPMQATARDPAAGLRTPRGLFNELVAVASTGGVRDAR